MSDFEHRVVRIPVYDTGIGKEAGFKDDKEMMEVAAKRRAALPPLEREMLDAVDAELENQFLYGEGIDIKNIFGVEP